MSTPAHPVVLAIPDRDTTLFPFISISNAYEGDVCTPEEVEATFRRERNHPLASGHFSAIQHAVKLASDPAWPVADAQAYRDARSADEALRWLRTLHEKLARPVADLHALNGTKGISAKDCGAYRVTPRFLGGDRPMPPPLAVRGLLRVWLADLGEFHLKARGDLGRPSATLYRDAAVQARRSHLMLQCVHPWADFTGRTARVVENALRLRWGLPWANPSPDGKIAYVREIMAFEDGPEWRQILRQNVAG